MKNTIPPIKAEIDYLDKNEREIYCVGDWVQTRIEGELTPVRFVSIRHDGATVSNSPYYDGTILSAEKILSNLYSLLNTGKDLFSTRPALCVQYAALLIEVDNAIVRLNIDKNILKSAIIKKGVTGGQVPRHGFLVTGGTSTSTLDTLNQTAA